MMKKVLVVFTCFALLLSFAACMKPDTQTTQPTETAEPQPTLPAEGNQLGNLCPGKDLPVIIGEGETGETINPAKTGKVTVINFWGTWCGPCVSELPHFDEVAETYSDTVTVIGIHSVEGRKKAPAYLAENFPDSKIVFSWEDSEGYVGDYYLQLGGGAGYPYTVILDANGIITFKQLGMMSLEQLTAEVEAAGGIANS